MSAQIVLLLLALLPMPIYAYGTISLSYPSSIFFVPFTCHQSENRTLQWQYSKFETDAGTEGGMLELLRQSERL